MSDPTARPDAASANTDAPFDPSATSSPTVPGPPTHRFPAYVVVRRNADVVHGPADLALDELPPGDVLVRVTWSSVNYKDAMVTQPGNRVARTSPLVPGVDLAGIVVAGPDDGPAPGAAVLAHGHDLGVARHGGFARFARLPLEWVIPVPPALTAREAMIIGTAGFTAALSVDQLERRGLEPGDGPVLVTGASGGVGSMAVSLLARRGYEVVASSGKTAERPWLEGIGARRVIGRDDLDVEAGRTLGPELWAGAVDCVGGTTLAQVIRTLRYGAAVAASGLTAGSGLVTTVFPFITRSVALLGIDSVATPEDRRLHVWARLADDLRPPQLDTLVAREIDLHGIDAALAEILDGRIRGRVLVRL
jgi:acrylyl-CoA reductase (NADPH)